MNFFTTAALLKMVIDNNRDAEIEELEDEIAELKDEVDALEEEIEELRSLKMQPKSSKKR